MDHDLSRMIEQDAAKESRLRRLESAMTDANRLTSALLQGERLGACHVAAHRQYPWFDGDELVAVCTQCRRQGEDHDDHDVGC